MHRFALALLEAADADGDVGPMTRFLAEQAQDLDRDTVVAISTVAVMFTALTTGVNVRTAAEATVDKRSASSAENSRSAAPHPAKDWTLAGFRLVGV